MRRQAQIALCLLLGTLPIAAQCGFRTPAPPLLVSSQWLAGHLHGPNPEDRPSVLALASRAFLSGHIPGARPLPGPGGDLVSALRRAGIRQGTTVVIYQQAGLPIAAAQAFTALEALGLGLHVSVLDGGMETWREGGYAIATGPEFATPLGDVAPCRNAEVRVDKAFVEASLGRPSVTLLDARLPPFFSGAAAEPGEPAGHIPGAVNLPYPAVASPDGELLPLAALRDLFRGAGVKQRDLVIVYCHSGRTASLPYFAGRLLGLNIRIYTGSWREWSAPPATK